jgi:phosphate transport system ATP-binding protein
VKLTESKRFPLCFVTNRNYDDLRSAASPTEVVVRMSTGFAKIMTERQASGRVLADVLIQKPKIETRELSVWYGKNKVLHGIDMALPNRCVTALIGPSGCGKSTFLRSINRMNDLVDGARIEGEILIEGQNIYQRGTDVVSLRKRVGMVFQKSNPFPKSIFENVVFGQRVAGNHDPRKLAELCEECLKRAALWNEVKDRLNESAMGLSGGQQQRLCIARALATNPDVLLMDEPASALDPASTARIEDLIFELKDNYTIVIVTHNMQQAARVSDQTAFFYQGQLIEVGPTDRIFTRPEKKHTEDYITGRFG